MLNCKVSTTPFKYLGLPLCYNPRRLWFLNHVVDRIRDRPSFLKCHDLSIEGRFILLILSQPRCRCTSPRISKPYKIPSLKLRLFLDIFLWGIGGVRRIVNTMIH